MAKSSIKVAIIGAGIAGIAAAKILQKTNNVEFRIFEATNRIGGRIWTHYSQDGDTSYKLEYGANWVHGVKGNPVHTIAVNNRLYEPLNNSSAVKAQAKAAGLSRFSSLNVTEDGEEISPDLHKAVCTSYFATVRSAEEFFERETEYELTHTNVADYVRHAMEETFGKYEDEDDRTIAREIMESLLLMECCISGCNSMADVSLDQFGSYEELQGRQPMIPQGFEQVVKCLARDIPADHILMNQAIKHITWKSQGLTPVTLSCESGQEFRFDAVIITSSLGFLKQHSKQLFTPSLPEEKQKAIGKLDIGTVDKIYLQFDNLDFLPPTLTRLHIARSMDKLKDVSGEQWHNKLYSFTVVSKPVPNTLMTWVTGQAAEYMEGLSDDQVVEGCMGVLRRALCNTHVPQPCNITRTEWYSLPYTRGSYTYIPVGATVQDIETLAKPLCVNNKPVVLFAGEATHTDFYSTVHGALLSGERESNRLLAEYGLSDN